VRNGIAPGILAVADAPYVGRRRFNLAKNQIAGETASIEKTNNGMMRFAEGDNSYTFNLDGKEYPMSNGGTTSSRSLDAKQLGGHQPNER
jgi:hypothetical protein